MGRRNFQPAQEENPGSEKKGGSEGGARRAPELSHSSLSLSAAGKNPEGKALPVWGGGKVMQLLVSKQERRVVGDP